MILSLPNNKTKINKDKTKKQTEQTNDNVIIHVRNMTKKEKQKKQIIMIITQVRI